MGWGWGGIENVIDRLRRVQVSEKLHLRQSQIHFFLWEGRAPGLLTKLERTALVKGLR